MGQFDIERGRIRRTSSAGRLRAHTVLYSGGGAIRPQETGASATYVVARVVTLLEDQVGWYLEVRVWIG